MIKFSLICYSILELFASAVEAVSRVYAGKSLWSIFLDFGRADFNFYVGERRIGLVKVKSRKVGHEMVDVHHKECVGGSFLQIGSVRTSPTNFLPKIMEY